MQPPKAHLLIDLDDTVADWGRNYDGHMAALFPHIPFQKHESRTEFDMFSEHTTPEGIAAVKHVMDLPAFYEDLEPLPGAVDALHEMVDDGYDVALCSAPWLTSATCASDKYAWAEEVLGAGWGARTILTRDKTRVVGDLLIDDKPNIRGALPPTWRQVFFTQPHNAALPGPRIDDWTAWRNTIEPLLAPTH